MSKVKDWLSRERIVRKSDENQEVYYVREKEKWEPKTDKEEIIFLGAATEKEFKDYLKSVKYRIRHVKKKLYYFQTDEYHPKFKRTKTVNLGRATQEEYEDFNREKEALQKDLKLIKSNKSSNLKDFKSRSVREIYKRAIQKVLDKVKQDAIKDTIEAMQTDPDLRRRLRIALSDFDNEDFVVHQYKFEAGRESNLRSKTQEYKWFFKDLKKDHELQQECARILLELPRDTTGLDLPGYQVYGDLMKLF